jgi:hypothetical protein
MPCRFAYFMRTSQGPSVYSAMLSGCYIAMKGHAYLRIVHDVILVCRNVLFGRQQYGRKLAKEAALEAGALLAPEAR